MADILQDLPNDPDNVAPMLLAEKKQQEFIAAQQWAAQMRGTPAAGGAATPVATAAPVEAQDDTDPLGVRIMNNVSEIPRGIGYGATNAGVEAIQSLSSLADALNQSVLGGNDLLSKVTDAGEGIENPIDKPKTTTGNLVAGVAQFVTGFIPALRAVRMASGGKAIIAAGRAGQAMAAGAITDAFVFDPHEERLSNLVEQFPEVSNPVTKFLQADSNDSEALGRFKNAVEGLGLGLAVDGFVAGVRAIRANRIAKGITHEKKLGEVNEPLPTLLGDKDAPIVGRDTMDAIATKQIPVTDLGKYVNFSKANEPDFIEKTIEHYARAIKLANDGKSLDDMVSETFAKTIDAPRTIRGARQNDAAIKNLAKDIRKQQIKLTDESMAEVAKKLNISPERFKQVMENTKETRSVKREQIEAVKMFLGDVDNRLKDMALKASRTSDNAVLGDFQRMKDIHDGIYSYYRGDGSAASAALRSFSNPVGSRAKQLAMLDERFMREGGPDGLRRYAKAITELDANGGDISKVLNPSRAKKITDAVVEAWYFNLLSGPKTHVANMLSNSLMTALQIPERALAAQFAKLRGATNSVQEGETSAMFFAMVKNAGAGIRAAGQTLKTGEQSDLFMNKMDHKDTRAITSKNLGVHYPDGSPGKLWNGFIDGIGSIARSPTRAIMAEDEFFKVIGKNMEMNALAYRMAKSEGLEGKAMADRIQSLLENPDADMLDQAQEFTGSITFSTPLGRQGQRLQEWSNAWPATKLFLPFVKTPINLLKQAAGRTPLGLLSSNMREAIGKGGAEADLAMARMSLGSMTILAVMDQVFSGNVTGAGPSEKSLQANWRMKNQPFSVKVNGTWYSYNRTDPFGIVIGAAATFAELAHGMSEKERDNMALAIAVATSRSVLNKTWMKGPSEFLDAMTQPDRYAEGWLNKTMGTLLVPAAVAQVTQTIDPVWRDVNGMFDAVRSRTPSYSDTLPPRRNLWGEPIMLEGGLGPDIVSPVYSMAEKEDPITSYIIDNGLGIALPAETQFEVELSPEEYSDFVEKAGRPAREHLNRIIAGEGPGAGEWAKGTDGVGGSREAIVERVIRTYRDAAKADMIKANPELRARVQRAESVKKMKFTGE